MVVEEVVDVTRTVKGKKGKGRNKHEVYLSGYHMLGGLAATFLISRLVEYFIPDSNYRRIKKGVLTGNPIKNVGEGIKLDKMIMLVSSAALTASEVFLNVRGGSSAGAGMVLGYIYLDSSRKSKYVGLANE